MDSWIAGRLLTGSLQGGVIIAVVWLVCRHIPRIPASMQAALWWLAALKLVLTLAPIPAVPLPLLPAPSAAEGPAPDLPPADFAVLDLLQRPAEPATAVDWIAIIVAIWIAGVLAQGVRLLIAYRGLRGVIGRSVPLGSADTDADTDADAALVPQLARMIGLTRLPDVRTSPEIAAPLVAGVRRPVVLLPESLAAEDRPMALCHEFMHVRRHDLALGWVPALAERLFFFHPLARLAAREYVTAREAACDAAVVRALGVSPDDYGRLLIRLGLAGSQPAFAAGGAPASMSSLRRRLDMLQHRGMTTISRRLAWALGAAALLAIVPFELSARTPAAQAAPTARPQTAPAPLPVERAAPAPQAAPRQEPRPVVPAPNEQADENWLRMIEERIEAAELARRQAREQTTERFERDRLYRMALQEGVDRYRRAEQDYDQRLMSTSEQLRVLREQQDVLLQQVKEMSEHQRQLSAEIQRLREALKQK